MLEEAGAGSKKGRVVGGEVRDGGRVGSRSGRTCCTDEPVLHPRTVGSYGRILSRGGTRVGSSPGAVCRPWSVHTCR